jgi:hypothetical protein
MKISKRDAYSWFQFFASLPKDEELINYQKEIVNNLVNEGKMEASIRARLLFSHYELSKAIKWLNKIDKSRLKRIYVAHLSGGHSDAEKIKNAIIGETGIPTTICDA